MDERDFLPLEAVAEHIVLRPLTAVHAAQAEGEFGIEIEVFNTGPNILTWDAQHPVTLSYRWFDMATGIPFPLEGSRAYFDDSLRPSSVQTLHLTIKSPAFHGMATLRISCVCEGRFWFYEMFPTGWTDLGVNVVDPTVWPIELRGSFASRALRGAVVANALQQRLIADPIRCMVPLLVQESAPETVAPTHAEEVFPAPPAFTPAPRAELPPGPLEASPPSLWPVQATIVPAPDIEGWKAWFRHPIATLGRYINQALTKSSLGRRLEATQVATGDLLERLRQSAQNDLHTQIMLRNMLRHQEQRDAYYAQAHYDQIDLLQQELGALRQELGALIRQEARAAQKFVVQEFRDCEQAHATERHETSGKMLRSIVEASRRTQLGLLKLGDDMEHRHQHYSEFQASTHRTHIDLVRQDLSELIYLKAEALKSAIAEGFLKEEQSHAQVMEGRHASNHILCSIVDISQDLRSKLQKLGDEMGRMHDAQTGVTTEINAVVREIQSGNQSDDSDWYGALTRIASLEPLGPKIGQIADSLQQITLSSAEELADLGRLADNLVEIRDFVQTDFGYLFAKIDALLHRQSFSAPASNKIICRNAIGLFAIPETDLETISYYASGHLPEPGSLALVQKLLKPGGTFIDVGANVGLFSVAAGRQVGPTGSILSFEPAPETMSALTATMRLNGLSPIVTLHQSAAGRENGTAKLNVGHICGHSSLLPIDDKRETIDVSVVVLDDIIGDRQVDLIKIDVEGWELEVLEGLRKTLANNRDASVLLEFGPSHLKRAGSDPLTWVATLQTFEMNIYEINEDDASLTPLRSQGFENIASINLLLSRKLENLRGQE